jgi:hypothetical protein
MSKRLLSNCFRCASLIAVLFLTGCSGQRELAKSQTTPIQGRLRLHGQPAAFVIIRLEPSVPNKGVAAEGTTDADGNFELRTYSNEGMDGAVPGEYKVILEEYDPVRSGPIPQGSKPTQILKGEMETDVLVQIRADNPSPEIDIP